MTTHSLSLTIDAKPAKSGAEAFTAAIAMVKRAVKDLERDASGAFSALQRPNTEGLREITRESKAAGTALDQTGSASDRAAANIQRTALASAMACSSSSASRKAAIRMALV